ncbi:hypothetical protein J0B02_12580 [Enterobacteriaceae bacterium YMB-R22]|jgi:hypothetical protein|nr:hypothetical protein [Tenebrionicola larvae]MBV4413648.1 hypothetical protein [Tenebrionicola larvae]MBV5095873.1 hypothetical protein [Tenebrionicola larvae]
MLNTRAIRHIHCCITLCLALVTGGFIVINYSDDNRKNDTLQHRYEINSGLWLYITENSNGGATVPVIYRYYLSSRLQGSDNDITNQLLTLTPFLAGYGSISDVKILSTDKIKISYNGRILFLNNSTTYNDNNKNITLKISYLIE